MIAGRGLPCLVYGGLFQRKQSHLGGRGITSLGRKLSIVFPLASDSYKIGL